MNRSILIVICDFLLVSLLAFSTVDINKVSNFSGSRSLNLGDPAETNHAGGRQDLGNVMRLALEDEQRRQAAMALQLSNAQALAGQQELMLNQRNAQLTAAQKQLRASAAEAAQLQERQAQLASQVNTAQSNIAKLNQQLSNSTVETLITKEQNAAEQSEKRKELERVAALERQLADLEKSNQLVLDQRQRLTEKLQLTETEKQAAAAQLAQARQDLSAQLAQNATLAAGVQALASKSSELAQELRAAQPLSPNALFNELATNRVTIDFEGVHPGFFSGETTKAKQTETILVSDGTNTYAVCHLRDTLLSLWAPAVEWKELRATITYDSDTCSVPQFSFYAIDPRVALLPVNNDWVRKSHCKVYRLAADPYRFQDAVVVGARRGYYGQCQFQMDLSTPQYLRMDRNTLKGLFGKFNPSAGDLVFSKNGTLLGVMANNTYCIILQRIETDPTVPLSKPLPGNYVSQTLASLYATVNGMPFKLQ